MSMNRYANAGPIMAGLAAMSEPVAPKAAEPATMDDMRHGMAFVTEAFRQMADIADQVSEIAAQMVDIRKLTLDLWKRIDVLEEPHKLREAARQAQQLATAQQAVTLPLKYDIDAGCWRSGSASFATDQALVDLRIQID